MVLGVGLGIQNIKIPLATAAAANVRVAANDVIRITADGNTRIIAGA